MTQDQRLIRANKTQITHEPKQGQGTSDQELAVNDKDRDFYTRRTVSSVNTSRVYR